MIEAKRLYTLLKLIRILSSTTPYSIPRLAQRFSVTTRTMYRYINLLEEAGFTFVKEKDRIKIDNPSQNEFLPLLDFDELSLLKDAVFTLHEQHPKRNELIKKLHALSDLEQVSELVLDAHKAKIYKKLIEAIQQKRQTRLLNYHSQNSQTRLDRLVEPLGFSANLVFLVAYDCEKNGIRLYKPSRIDEIEILDQTFKITDKHSWKKPDAFGMNGNPKCEAHLKLSPFAQRLIEEEYPVTKTSLPETFTKTAEIRLEIQGFDGIGRFILGLPGEIEVLEPQELINYLKERQRKKMW